TGDLFLAELGVAGIDVVFLNVNRRERVVLHQVLAPDDGVLKVEALPRHERNKQVLAEGEFTVLGSGAVSDDLAGLDTLALLHDDAVVVARALLRAVELAQEVALAATLVLLNRDDVSRHL